MTRILIYTDLDGTLLDHHSYSHAPADALLAQLERDGIPVIPCTSKTRAELLPLREELHNRHPFIVENGAAVIVPRNYFERRPAGLEAAGDFLIKRFVEPRSHWLQLIGDVAEAFRGQFRGFSAMDEHSIVALTGLDAAAAARAAQREFGEPIHWTGDADQRQAFISAIESAGAQVLQGGRFMHVSGKCDKGSALRWLNHAYAEADGEPPVSIAVGDSHNDIAMLEAAEHALIVRSPAHPPPELSRNDKLTISEAFGPQGWDEGVRRILTKLKKSPEETRHG